MELVTQLWRVETVQLVVPQQRLVLLLGWAERDQDSKEIVTGYAVRPVVGVEVLLESGYGINKPLKATCGECASHEEFIREKWTYLGRRVRHRPVIVDDGGVVVTADELETTGNAVVTTSCWPCAWEPQFDEEGLSDKIEAACQQAKELLEEYEAQQGDEGE